MPKRGTEAAVETENWVERVPSLVDPERPESKTLFVSRIEKIANVSRTKARLIFDSAIDLGYIKCERIETSDNAQRSTKFVLPGDVRPVSEDAGDEDEDDG